jgi:hypothetical protein
VERPGTRQLIQLRCRQLEDGEAGEIDRHRRAGEKNRSHWCTPRDGWVLGTVSRASAGWNSSN